MFKVVPTQLSLFADFHTTGITPSTFLLLVLPGKMAWGRPSWSINKAINLMFSEQ